ncbi:MAG: acetyl-CoA carboxylase biotin carboxyl carrier protein [Rhodothermales bacterium]|nr:acetyl-CoA carboxylase biotin carboxyl carrier protein [Rhodothermales bacterium]
MDLAQIQELLRIVAESGVAEVEIEEEGMKVVVRRSGATVMMQPAPMYPGYGLNAAPPMPAYAAPPPMPAYAAPPATPAAPEAAPSAAPAAPEAAPPAKEEAPSEAGHVLKAPIVGTFYRSPAPDADAYVEVGDAVKKGDVLCIIEAMKLMNEIECEVAGTVTKILVDNAEPVEYDQPLFVIDPA